MRLRIDSKNLAMMMEDAAHWAPKETGGVLVGYLQPTEIIVTATIGPGPNSEHYDYGFLPDYDYQESEIARLYHSSGRYWTYLGDWHSHPGGTARLSKIDRRTLRYISRTPEARISNPVMIILHDNGNWQSTGYQLTLRWLIRRITIHNMSRIPGIDGLHRVADSGDSIADTKQQ